MNTCHYDRNQYKQALGFWFGLSVKELDEWYRYCRDTPAATFHPQALNGFHNFVINTAAEASAAEAMGA